MSKEHAVPAWVGEVLHALEPEGAEWRSSWAYGTAEVSKARGHAAPGNRPVVEINCVCVACNTGWMADLEAATQPILAPMIRGERAALSTASQLTLTTWSAKTVVVLENLRRDLRVVTQQERDVLRLELRPPHTFRARLAAVDDPGAEPLRYQTYVATTVVPDGEPDVLCSTLLVGHVVIQVWGGEGVGPVDLQQGGTLISDAVMIWPPVPGIAAWPPKVCLTADTIEAFLRQPIPGFSGGGFIEGWSWK